MHMFVDVVLHATVLAIMGYALLWSASKVEGVVALIGKVLGVWVFLLAILSVVAVATMPMFGGKPFGIDMTHGHDPGWMHRIDRDRDGGATPSARPENPAPAKP